MAVCGKQRPSHSRVWNPRVSSMVTSFSEHVTRVQSCGTGDLKWDTPVHMYYTVSGGNSVAHKRATVEYKRETRWKSAESWFRWQQGQGWMMDIKGMASASTARCQVLYKFNRDGRFCWKKHDLTRFIRGAQVIWDCILPRRLVACSWVCCRTKRLRTRKSDPVVPYRHLRDMVAVAIFSLTCPYNRGWYGQHVFLPSRASGTRYPFLQLDHCDVFGWIRTADPTMMN